MQANSIMVRQLKAISNIYRLEIIYQLVDGEKNVTELRKPLHISQPALSQHLSKLKAAKILSCRRQHREIYYFIADARVLQLLGVAKKMAGE